MLRNPFAYEGEDGFNIQLNTTLEATGYTATFVFQKPDGTRVSKSATAVTTAADGDFYWLVEEDFLTQGRWWVRLVLTSGSSVLKGDIEHFTVGAPGDPTA